MLAFFPKIPPPTENIKTLRLKEYCKTIQKRKLQPRIKSMIQNLKDELYQLENKQPKDVKLCANMR